MPVRAAQLNQPLIAFQTAAHPGQLGRAFSFLKLDDTTGAVAAVAVKKAEDSDEIVVRLQERYGSSARTTLRVPGPLAAAREINAPEGDVGPIDLAARRGRRGQGRAGVAHGAPP